MHVKKWVRARGENSTRRYCRPPAAQLSGSALSPRSAPDITLTACHLLSPVMQGTFSRPLRGLAESRMIFGGLQHLHQTKVALLS